MIYRSLFPRDVYSDLERLQREMAQLFDASPIIRGFGRGGYPALNVGGTPQSVEIYAFAPGLDPAKIDVNIDRGVLTVEGERASSLPSADKLISRDMLILLCGTFLKTYMLGTTTYSERRATLRHGLAARISA